MKIILMFVIPLFLIAFGLLGISWNLSKIAKIQRRKFEIEHPRIPFSDLPDDFEFHSRS